MNEDNTFYYWINLSGRSDRRLHMLEQFAKNNISRHIRITPIQMEKSLSSCTLSHMKAILTAYYDCCEYAIILEDDIILEDVESICKITSNLSSDWEIFQFHTSCPYLYENLSGDKKYHNQIIKGHLMSAAGYVINRKGIIKYVNSFINVIDTKHLIFTTKITDYETNIPESCIYVFMNVYFLLYPLFNTIHTTSSIADQNQDYDELNSKCISYIKSKHNHLNDIRYDLTFDNGIFHWYSRGKINELLEKLEPYTD